MRDRLEKYIEELEKDVNRLKSENKLFDARIVGDIRDDLEKMLEGENEYKVVESRRD